MAEEDEQGAGPHESHRSALSVIQKLTEDRSDEKDDGYNAILGVVGQECQERLGCGEDVSMIPEKVIGEIDCLPVAEIEVRHAAARSGGERVFEKCGEPAPVVLAREV